MSLWKLAAAVRILSWRFAVARLSCSPRGTMKGYGHEKRSKRLKTDIGTDSRDPRDRPSLRARGSPRRNRKRSRKLAAAAARTLARSAARFRRDGARWGVRALPSRRPAWSLPASRARPERPGRQRGWSRRQRGNCRRRRRARGSRSGGGPGAPSWPWRPRPRVPALTRNASTEAADPARKLEHHLPVVCAGASH